MSAALAPGYHDWAMYYPEDARCSECNAQIETAMRRKEEHKEWCSDHPGYSLRAERIVRDVLAMHFYDMHFRPDDVSISTTRHSNGEISVRVECRFTHFQIEEAA